MESLAMKVPSLLTRLVLSPLLVVALTGVGRAENSDPYDSAEATVPKRTAHPNGLYTGVDVTLDGARSSDQPSAYQWVRLRFDGWLLGLAVPSGQVYLSANAGTSVTRTASLVVDAPGGNRIARDLGHASVTDGQTVGWDASQDRVFGTAVLGTRAINVAGIGTVTLALSVDTFITGSCFSVAGATVVRHYTGTRDTAVEIKMIGRARVQLQALGMTLRVGRRTNIEVADIGFTSDLENTASHRSGQVLAVARRVRQLLVIRGTDADDGSIVGPESVFDLESGRKRLEIFELPPP